MVEQRGRAETSGHGQCGLGGGSHRKHRVSFSCGPQVAFSRSHATGRATRCTPGISALGEHATRHAAVEARNLAPLPADVDHIVAAAQDPGSPAGAGVSLIDKQ